MKKNMSIPHYIASTRIGQGFLVLCGLLMASCSQDELHVANDKTDEISFQTTNAQTRGLIQDLAKEGTEICMYGYHNGNVLGGTDKPLEGKKLKYSAENQSWNIVDDSGNPITYYWQGDGTYKFFGWLAKDATGLTVPFSTSFEQNKLKIPETELKKNYNQFDFLYSEVHTRTLPTDGKGAVPVNMKHLFTAFGIGISNSSGDDITINEITLRCVQDKGSAEIDFNDNEAPRVTYGNTTKSYTGNDSYISYTMDYTIPAKTGVKLDAFKPDATDKKFYMLWPQAAGVVHPELNYATEEEKLAETDLSKFPLIIKYTVGGQTFEKRMEFPAEAWEAGKLNYFDLVVADKLVELTATVTPWDFTSADINYAEQTITVKAENHLKYNLSTCTIDNDNRRVYVKDGQAIEATFCIDTPLGGQWHASLVGDTEAFEIHVDENNGNDGNNNFKSGAGPIDGLQHKIRIAPAKGYESPDKEYNVQLRFIVITPDGKTLNADDMVQDSDNAEGADFYTIVNRP